MDQLIDDLLKLSRQTSGELNKTTVNLSMMARDVAAELGRSQGDRKVTFLITEGLVAHCDQRLIKVVLDNLLGNAWKFTGKRRRRSSIDSDMIDGTPTYFVRDNGAGFDMAFSDKLFGTFQRLHLDRDFPAPASACPWCTASSAPWRQGVGRGGGRQRRDVLFTLSSTSPETDS